MSKEGGADQRKREKLSRKQRRRELGSRVDERRRPKTKSFSFLTAHQYEACRRVEVTDLALENKPNVEEVKLHHGRAHLTKSIRFLLSQKEEGKREGGRNGWMRNGREGRGVNGNHRR